MSAASLRKLADTLDARLEEKLRHQEAPAIRPAEILKARGSDVHLTYSPDTSDAEAQVPFVSRRFSTDERVSSINTCSFGHGFGLAFLFNN